MLRKLIICLSALAATASVRADVSIDRLIEDADLREGPIASRDLPGWSPPQKLVVWDTGDLVAALQEEFPGVAFVAAPSVEAARSAAPDADAIIG